jgi:hypothetical protein
LIEVLFAHPLNALHAALEKKKGYQVDEHSSLASDDYSFIGSTSL